MQTAGGGPGMLTYILNGAAPVELVGATSFTFNGLAGNDRMTVVIPDSGAMVRGNVVFDGGAQNDTLVVDANGLQIRVAGDKVSAGASEGATQSILFSGVEAANLNNTLAVNSFFGPNTASRDTTFIGLSAQQRFVQALYLNVLGRAGSPVELNGWVAVHNQEGSEEVARQIEHSIEGRTRLVRTWYQAYLGRAALGGEEQGWVSALLNGADDYEVLSQILGSQEFFLRAQTLVATGTANERFVKSLYLLLLDRTADAAGLAGWGAAIGTVGRTAVANSFLISAEHRSYTIDAYFAALLRRPGDDPSEAYWEGFWTSQEPTTTEVRIAFEASDEFFANG